MVATGATIILLRRSSTALAIGSQVVFGLPLGWVPPQSNSPLVPLCFFIYELLIINVVLAVFNLIPVPPLDGSHVIAPFPAGIALRKIYDTVGMDWSAGAGLFGRRTAWQFDSPVREFFNYILVRV